MTVKAFDLRPDPPCRFVDGIAIQLHLRRPHRVGSQARKDLNRNRGARAFGRAVYFREGARVEPADHCHAEKHGPAKQMLMCMVQFASVAPRSHGVLEASVASFWCALRPAGLETLGGSGSRHLSKAIIRRSKNETTARAGDLRVLDNVRSTLGPKQISPIGPFDITLCRLTQSRRRSSLIDLTNIPCRMGMKDTDFLFSAGLDGWPFARQKPFHTCIRRRYVLG